MTAALKHPLPAHDAWESFIEQHEEGTESVAERCAHEAELEAVPHDAARSNLPAPAAVAACDRPDARTGPAPRDDWPAALQSVRADRLDAAERDGAQLLVRPERMSDGYKEVLRVTGENLEGERTVLRWVTCVSCGGTFIAREYPPAKCSLCDVSFSHRMETKPGDTLAKVQAHSARKALRKGKRK